ncbi:MAG: alpha/beta fold hydrolase [Caldilineaceae bacterium]|nr:alpha/beta fold hydrolase [Caldilineaceae bacterium]
MRQRLIQRIHMVVRMVWIAAGLAFLGWQAWSFQAQGYDFAQRYQSPTILISEDDAAFDVMPIAESQSTGLIFYPGGMVDPRAYLPMAHALARRSYPVIIVKLPYRSAWTAAQEAAVHDYVRGRISDSIIERWAVGGHSRGAALATHFAHQYPTSVAALILVGTTHPKEAAWSLATRKLPVTKIYGTADGIADAETILANRDLLPADAAFLPIEGGNHSQFGYYGSQLGDGRATISREEQQAQLIALIGDVLAGLQE